MIFFPCKFFSFRSTFFGYRALTRSYLSLKFWVSKLIRGKSKAPVSQLVNAEVNSGNRVTQSSYATRIRGRHAGMKCDLIGIKHCSHCVWLAQESKNKSLLTRKLRGLNTAASLNFFRILRLFTFLAIPPSEIELPE